VAADDAASGGDEQFMLGLVEAVLDGTPLDWSTAETIASDSQRALLAHLRSVAAIASFSGESSLAESSPLPTRHRPATPPQRAAWSHLHLLESIGRGAFATVYRAWDPQLHREVALKLLPTGQRDEESALTEGRLLARVHHPNVVTIFGADRADGFVDLWMELVRGRTLEEMVAGDGPLAADRVAAIGTQLCGALSAVHRSGLVHRDVKAHNVMIDGDGRLVLMDFGTGRSLEELRASDIAGTPLYLPPEAFSGERATMQGDQYSVAVLLYHLLTARYPVEGSTLHDVKSAHARDTVERDVRRSRPDVPRRTAAAIARGLSRNPAGRFESVDAMARALAPAESTAPAWVRRAAIGAAVGAVVALAATGGGRQLLRRAAGATSPGRIDTAGSAPSTRRLDVKGRWGPASLSRNGRSFAVVTNRAPAVFDMVTGDLQKLPAPTAAGAAEFAIASPDGQLVAYQWWPGEGEPYELRIADRSGRRADRVVFRDANVDIPRLYDWSHDGAHLLAKLALHDGRVQIALIDVATSTTRIVHEIRHGSPDPMSLSIDGHYVAYDLPDESTTVPHRSIRIVDTVNGGERLLFDKEPADSRFPLWMSDGRSLFFLSDRSGTPDGWIVPVLGGRASGDPQIAARNIGAITPLGVTDSGSFYYDFQAGQFDVYEAALDPASMTPSAAPRSIRGRRQGSNIGPAYSHDGRRLAYLSQRTTLGEMTMARRTIVVRDLTTGSERDLAPTLDPGMAGPLWSPDDRLLVVNATNRANEWGAFVIDVRSGDVVTQIVWPRTELSTAPRLQWARDGRAILFTNAKGIVEHRLDTGKERVVFASDRIPAGPGMNSFAYAGNGTLAFTRWNQQTALDVVGADGVLRELVTVERPRALNFQAWFPEGDELLYSTSSGPREPDQLWRIPLAGGTPHRVGPVINNLTTVNMISLHPSGASVAYTNGYVKYELWMMEHMLSR
jgi:Tol biopolymer transport system component